MKKTVDAFDYAGTICSALKTGVLLTTKFGDKTNTMTIGWGMVGREWNKPVFIAYVRESRYTRQLLDQSGVFTVNIPLQETDGQIIKICGTKSGRDLDKIQALSLTPVSGNKVDVPGLLEFPLTLECRVLYQRKQDISLLNDAIADRFYPIQNDCDSRDSHIVYYGEILDAYILEA